MDCEELENTQLPFLLYPSKERFHSRDQHLCKFIGTKRKSLHKKGVQLPQDWFGTPTWPPFGTSGRPY